MNDAEKRAANRDRVAENLDAGYVPPGMTGAEILALSKIAPAISTDKGKTQYEGGWKGTGHNRYFPEKSA